MLFIREERIHQALITMMNKLKFGYNYVLIPLSKQLETSNQDENYEKITEIEEQFEITKDKLNTLIQLMTKGFLEPAIFNEQKIELSQRHRSEERRVGKESKTKRREAPGREYRRENMMRDIA